MTRRGLCVSLMERDSLNERPTTSILPLTSRHSPSSLNPSFLKKAYALTQLVQAGVRVFFYSDDARVN